MQQSYISPSYWFTNHTVFTFILSLYCTLIFQKSFLINHLWAFRRLNYWNLYFMYFWFHCDNRSNVRGLAFFYATWRLHFNNNPFFLTLYLCFQSCQLHLSWSYTCISTWGVHRHDAMSSTCNLPFHSLATSPDTFDHMPPSLAHFHELLLQLSQLCWCRCQDRGNLCLVVLNILYLDNLWMCVVVSKLFYFANNRDCSSIMLSLKHYPLASNTIKMDNCTSVQVLYYPYSAAHWSNTS